MIFNFHALPCLKTAVNRFKLRNIFITLNKKNKLLSLYYIDILITLSNAISTQYKSLIATFTLNFKMNTSNNYIISSLRERY